jgi:hypothetical protein
MAVKGFFGQRLLESVVRGDLGIDSKSKKRRFPAREFIIYDLAEKAVPKTHARAGDAKLTWIRGHRAHVMEELTRLAPPLEHVKPRDPETREAVAQLIALSEAQVRSQAEKLARHYFERRRASAEEDTREIERYVDPDPFTLQRALDVVQTAPGETLQQILVTTECMGRGYGFLQALEAVARLDGPFAELEEGWLQRWTWEGALGEVLELLDFEDKQAQVLADLMRVTKGTLPDYVALEYHIKAGIKVLRRAHVYEAKTGKAVLTAGQGHAFAKAVDSEFVEYKVVHVDADLAVPPNAAVSILRSGGSH